MNFPFVFEINYLWSIEVQHMPVNFIYAIRYGLFDLLIGKFTISYSQVRTPNPFTLKT